ncbi:helix-turn-helix transcriptional regulator [bacterium SCSIO 12741]|nr:helix-turn-helix transcriptional regulator [bacterium SCSIO 12741]
MNFVYLHIKNMVCPRCIQRVVQIMEELQLPYVSVELGQVTLQKNLSQEEREGFRVELMNSGFELLEDRKSQLIDQIKRLVLSYVRADNSESQKLSDYLTEHLHINYTSISKLFSSVEGKTLERYLVTQRMERVKELLFYDEFTLNEIAHQLNFSSVAYLSAQFKKETGMTPTAFKDLRTPGHQSLDKI